MIRSRSFVFSASLLAAGLAAQGQPTQELRIGTWNLEWLGIDDRGGLPPRDATDYQKLGDKVRSLGVAVLAVQEIGGEAPLQRVAAAAGPAWRVVLGTTGGIEGKPQNVGFLYDSGTVELLQAEELVQLPREQDGVPIFNRLPVTACFRAKATGFDFRAITVHLKAGQKAQDEQKRRLEASLLHDWIAGLQQASAEDQDIVVLGDFNSTYGTDPQLALERGGSLQYLQPAAPTPTIMHFPEPIDQVAVAPGFDELGRTSFTVHGGFDGMEKDAWRKTYSDHFPVTVTITAANDTDPAATFRVAGAAGALPVSRRAAEHAAAAAAAPAGRRDAKQPAGVWPPAVGSRITVWYGTAIGGGPAEASGKLLAEMPTGPGGWLVLEVAGAPRAIPYPQVYSVALR